MRLFESYIKDVRKKGRLYFTTAQALTELNVQLNALYAGLHTLKRKGEIVSPAKGLFIIVPPEEQTIGCIPAEQLIPILMEHWGAEYYAGLLTAAMYHGASHQKPQVFQVVTNKRSKSVVCGKIKVDFIYKKSPQNVRIQKIAVRTGYLNISTPEATAYDLLLYPHHSGGLNNIATLLGELIEVVEPDSLIELAKEIRQRVWIQRLGYILDSIDVMDDEKKDRVLQKAQSYLANLDLYYVPLTPDLPTKGYPKNKKWMIIENTTIESDL
jgi:predicted transcriptional regulator of viral defense system